MSANVHIHLHVSDLEASRNFYASFFGEAPVKERPDYAKFLPKLGPVNLALSGGSLARTAHNPVNHLGIQIDSKEAVAEQMQRVKAAGLDVRVETGVDCCHANSDKFWVTDPDGVQWEVYHLNYDLDLEETVVPEGAKQPDACAPSASGGCCG